MAGKISYYINR